MSVKWQYECQVNLQTLNTFRHSENIGSKPVKIQFTDSKTRLTHIAVTSFFSRPTETTAQNDNINVMMLFKHWIKSDTQKILVVKPLNKQFRDAKTHIYEDILFLYYLNDSQMYWNSNIAISKDF